MITTTQAKWTIKEKQQDLAQLPMQATHTSDTKELSLKISHMVFVGIYKKK